MDSNKMLSRIRITIGLLTNLFFPGLGHLIAGFIISGFVWFLIWVAGWTLFAVIIGEPIREATSLIFGSVNDREFLPFIFVFKGASLIDLFLRFRKKERINIVSQIPDSSIVTDPRLDGKIIKFFDKVVWVLPAFFIIARLVIHFFGGGFLGEAMYFSLAAIILQGAGFLLGWQATKLKDYTKKLYLMFFSLLLTTSPFMFYLYFMYSFSKVSW